MLMEASERRAGQDKQVCQAGSRDREGRGAGDTTEAEGTGKGAGCGWPPHRGPGFLREANEAGEGT